MSLVEEVRHEMLDELQPLETNFDVVEDTILPVAEEIL